MDVTMAEKALTIQEKFENFHAKKPEVYDYLVKTARLLKSRGHTKYGIGSIYERTRWHFEVDMDAGEEYKLNNNYRSRYVRKIIAEHKDLEKFFELRQLKAA